MFRRGVKGIAIFLVALIDNLVFIPVYFFTVCLLRPWRSIVPKIYWTFESCIFRELMFTVAHWSWFSGVRILEFGDNLEDYVGDRCLVLANHQSTADVLTLLSSFCQKFPCGGQLLWILHVMFKWSHFGIVSQLHGDFFIEQGRARRREQSVLLRTHLERKYWSRGRNWIILFPEGGFYSNLVEDGQLYAKKHGYPLLRWCTLPRMGAVKCVMDTCRNYMVDDEFDRKVRYLIDVTIIFEDFKKPLNIIDFVTGLSAPTTIRVVYKVQQAALLPEDEEAMKKHLYEMWKGKDAMMKSFYATGQIEEYPDHIGRQLTFSYRRWFFQHLFFYGAAVFYTWLIFIVYRFVRKNVFSFFLI